MREEFVIGIFLTRQFKQKMQRRKGHFKYKQAGGTYYTAEYN